MSFHNVRLPVDVEKGAQGGGTFNTTVLQLSSGYEKRNINWQRSRGEWDIGYGMNTKANQENVIAFFYARRGRAFGFRFKDWTDYQIGTVGSPQQIGTGDGTTRKFQIYRRYADTASVFNRAVTRIVANTTKVFVNGVEQSTGFSVADDTGIITFTTAPPAISLISVICEFDIPVRFDIDSLELDADRDDAFSIPNVKIIEIREVLGSLT